MALTNSQYDSIMRSYEEKQRIARLKQEKNTNIVYQSIPGYELLDRQSAAVSIEHAKRLLGGNGGASGELRNELSSLKRELGRLAENKAQLLRAHGYPEDFLEPKYECAKCHDTGYINNEKCSCFKLMETELIYEQSHIRNLLNTENFSALSYDYYEGNDREKFTNAVQICQNFVKGFHSDYQNLFFYGTVGTGKSFLSCCVAKELMDKGNLVIYFNSSQLFDTLSRYIFDKEGSIPIEINSCDLLIIDDLGTELTNSFVSSQLFSCLNSRHLRRKSTIITTNLSISELRDRYSDRIFSRITSYYTICKLTGPDIRMLKKLQKNQESEDF